MTKKDFFILSIKLFGLFSLVRSLFSVIPNNISVALMEIDAASILWLILTIAVILGLFLLLIFKADKIVSLLKLQKGFDDDRIVLGNLLPAEIVKIGTFIIGGLLIINNVPGFLSHTLFAFKGENIGFNFDAQDKFRWAVSGINLIVGYLLLTNYNFVARRIGSPEEKTGVDR